MFDPSTLRYDDRGLIPAVAQDHKTGEVLMVAWMTQAAVERTLATGEVTYWSRSRQELWIKGATSGHVQKLIDFRFDCDSDCVLVLIEQTGPACHTNRRSCFYTAVREGETVELMQPEEG
ncbi:phosphoribosyl-AMP cyclohydrolase [Haematobacter massiliensis]|uniref:Phosphoribosyl-AMP cyclohydrolase n=1 Tax=Haematobacter massiliensis TaxID=195105 RepID=A0A086YC73_9RHOB|nr:phosphoribosyl-AMP cyclohydrolase [Haematobacter massiliensis]KFI31873.1 phosphoribosyl-AMP cyclohydrolase [Haematobacter massiliensis]OWJ72476.1 phosphoribosyl-AMP cyclohydrolase [Haematobacter massiliensis]OWJ87831.1 phosphoribosyl-AMP cyclohydrolase [Haematobacter massiliensis]QBJ24267.1 phosphoribosyl-AMP cyclohydrolase [Haematobacter massiliensis]